MCGIVGVVGNRNATDILMQGLEKLEYRGYDSAGIYVINQPEPMGKRRRKMLIHMHRLQVVLSWFTMVSLKIISKLKKIIWQDIT